MITDEGIATLRALHITDHEVASSAEVACGLCWSLQKPCREALLLDALAEARQMAQAWEHAACARQTERDAAISELGEWRNRFGDKS